MQENKDHIFSGTIYIFQAFDISDDIDLEQVKTSKELIIQPLQLPKYFKNYHIPLMIELPHPHESGKCMSVKLHNFGAVSLTYKIPFEDTLSGMRSKLSDITNQYQEQAFTDMSLLFKKIKQYTSKPQFFYTQSSYVLIQVNPERATITTSTLQEKYGGVIASALRFETETLSEYQKSDILESATGYMKGDLLVIDMDAAFAYDDQAEEILDLFEFGNIQQLELRYFEQLLDRQLTSIYEEKTRKVPVKAYLPFIGTILPGPIDELTKLRVDISVITERLEGSIKSFEEPYYSEIYSLLIDKLELQNTRESINKKLSIMQDIRSVWQKKVDSIKEDILTVSIIILIFIELIVAMIK